ncbi:glycerol-3-phosphate dehydrogenase/oxidase [Burkholderiaceae bacterium DAT-1]|nr:glycerol-3-phosphate dehydrogenase/oxidase [Burkholderiaceae bacterium DAT-1]
MGTSRPSLAQLSEQQWDVIIIGGGITGAGVALESVRNGLRTLLLEQKDFAWGTSSRSSKLVHGGLRYLKEGDLRLTRESVVERDALMKGAPGLVEPMPFLWPHYQDVPGTSPAVMDIGLGMYDLLSGHWRHRKLNAEEALKQMPSIRKQGLKAAHQYLDASTDDARLVLRVLLDAESEGATLRNYTRALPLIENGVATGVSAECGQTHEVQAIKARLIINASGVWADRLHGKQAIRPLRGSHLLVHGHALPLSQALAFNHPDDGRPVFAYPWQGHTLVGTTDIDHHEDLELEAAISEQECDYLLRACKHAFPAVKLGKPDILSTWSGVRPVVGGQGGDPSKERRDHVVWTMPGMISVTGGKLTTFRRMARDALKAGRDVLGLHRLKRAPVFKDGAPPTLPGLGASAWQGLRGRHGKRLETLMQSARHDEWHGFVGQDRLLAEVRWALQHEHVVHLDDLLLRRTRLGLVVRDGAATLKDTLQAMCADELGWDAVKWQIEWSRWRIIWNQHYSLPEQAVSGLERTSFHVA